MTFVKPAAARILKHLTEQGSLETATRLIKPAARGTWQVIDTATNKRVGQSFSSATHEELFYSGLINRVDRQQTTWQPTPRAFEYGLSESATKEEKTVRVALTEAQVETVHTALCHYLTDHETRLHALTPYSPEWERQRELVRLAQAALQAVEPHTAPADEEEEE
jgi:hypothetical protein